MNIALVSLNQLWENKEANLLLCEKYIKQVSNNDIQLVIFPEMTLTGFSMNVNKIIEDENTSKTIENFVSLARQYNVAIIFGIAIDYQGKAQNRSYCVNNLGEIIAVYTKIHPFSFSGEDNAFQSGNKLSIALLNGYKVGLTICYDLRFPELYSALAKQCDLIVNIANWPKRRVKHWNTLLQARAIENQLFVIGVNRTGFDGNGLEYQPSSVIYNANGDELEYMSDDLVKCYQIDKEWTINFRRKFATVDDRRVDVYKEIL